MNTHLAGIITSAEVGEMWGDHPMMAHYLLRQVLFWCRREGIGWIGTLTVTPLEDILDTGLRAVRWDFVAG